MKYVLDNGEIKELLSDSGEGGWSKEVHLVNYKNKRYVVRKCKSLERAKQFELWLKKFASYKIFPKFYGRYANDILVEYIDGRDLHKKESREVIEQIGRICAIVNKYPIRQKSHIKFQKWINPSVIKLIGKTKSRKVKKLYYHLEGEAKPKSALDCGDLNPDNFRLRKGRVYLTDLDSVVRVVKGYGLGKAFIKWFKSEEDKDAFKRGYSKISSADFLTETYEDYVILYFLIHEIELYSRVGKKFKPKIKERFEKVDELLTKYSGVLK